MSRHSGRGPYRLSWLLLAFALAAAPACGQAPSSRPLPAPPSSGGKVLVIGIPGVTWEDLEAARSPTLTALSRSWMVGNVSVRVNNSLTDGYATLGAGSRVETDGSAAWAFNLDEQVEHGPASELFRRRSGPLNSGAVAVVTIRRINDRNRTENFGGQPGLLGEELRRTGRKSAVVGNADHSLQPLPSMLPSVESMNVRRPPEIGIHREAALAVMDASGIVPLGDVSRSLLEASPDAPYGVAASPGAVREAFSKVWSGATYVVVETGDTYRADTYSQGVGAGAGRQIRKRGIDLADRQIAAILEGVDLQSTLVVIFGPTTPGGPGVRGQLRPVLLHAPGAAQGLLTSSSTRRPGLVTVSDLSASIARHLNLTDHRFAAGRAVEASQSPGGVSDLVEMNSRAVVHDRLRVPITTAIVGLQLVLYAVVIIRMIKGRLPRWLAFILVSSIAFPLASFVSLAVWKAGPIPAAAAILASTLALGALASWAGKKTGLGAPLLVLAAAAGFLIVDQLAGAPAQLDSVYGYTSVAAGRFYGLGNLGFALLAASTLLLGGMVTDHWGTRGRWAAMGVIVFVAVVIGHPKLGDDIGGILTMVAAGAIFGFRAWKRDRIPWRALPAIALGAILVLVAFAAIDLARPPSQRTHMGDFLEALMNDRVAVWLVIQRKATLAFSLAIQNYWAVVAGAAIGVLVFLHRHSVFSWGELVKDHPGLRAGLDSLLVAALIGSILNDSGVAVAGMMLAVGAPWALLMTADMASAKGRSPRAGGAQEPAAIPAGFTPRRRAEALPADREGLAVDRPAREWQPAVGEPGAVQPQRPDQG